MTAKVWGEVRRWRDGAKRKRDMDNCVVIVGEGSIRGVNGNGKKYN